ncbi:YjcZ family sporulation protein [Haladaptatus sp. W1]|uniref:YjcZ family sporulation protein n=2 Tax=Haladaptatus sp. W1 TaxID=1897478 RepID=UPI0009F47EA1|nr:YjcZ family sporulation protein [Haladaptatus sp. W1]
MSDETSSEVDTNSFPLQQSRRTLVRLLGSAIAMGAISGSAVGGGDNNDRKCTVANREDKRNDSFDLNGLSLSDDEFHLEWMQFTPTIDGETKEMFAIEGFAATIKNDEVTRMDVDSIEVHEDLEKIIMESVSYLADGDIPDEFNTAPTAIHEYLDHIDTRHFEHLQTVMEKEGGTDMLEHRLQNNVPMDADTEGYTGGFVLILVLFILLVIIGAGFGLGGGSSGS